GKEHLSTGARRLERVWLLPKHERRLERVRVPPNMRGDSNHEPAIDSSAESLGSPRPCASLFEAERVRLLHALDVDTEAAQIGDEVLVAAFDVVDSRHFGDSAGAQSGHDETCPCTDVRGLDLGAGEAVGAGHKRVVAIDAHLGTEPCDLLDEAPACLE